MRFFAFVCFALTLRAQTIDGLSIDELNKQIARQPTSALYAARAAEQLRLGNAQLAVDDYSLAIRFRLDDPTGWIGRGKALNELGQYSKAVDNFDQAVKLDPTLLAPYADRGYAYGQMGDFPRAIQDFDLVISRDPKNVRALSLRGAAWARLNRPEKALADREAVVNLAPASAEAYVARGGSYHELGMHDKGLADRAKAIALDPGYEPAWLARGSANFLLGKYEDATRDLKQALILKPDDAEAKAVLAKAAEAMAPAKTEPPQIAAVKSPVPEAATPPQPASRQPEPVVAVAVAPAPTPLPAKIDSPKIESPKSDPKAAALHNQRGRDLMNQGKYAAAIEELNAALAAQPDLALAYNARGFSYYLLRDYPHALADFDEAIRLNPGYPNALQNRELARGAASRAQKSTKP